MVKTFQASLIKATGGIKWQSPSNKIRQERDKRLTTMVAVMVGRRIRVCISIHLVSPFNPILSLVTSVLETYLNIDPKQDIWYHFFNCKSMTFNYKSATRYLVLTQNPLSPILQSNLISCNKRRETLFTL